MKYIIMPILILELFIVSSCSVKHVVTADKTEQESALMIEALENAILDTPYCALIEYTSVEVFPLPDPYPDDDDVEEKHIYHARVIETFRGQQLDNISYISFSEKGDGARISAEPVVITLCFGNEGFYWPGVGSLFPATEDVIKSARRISQKAKFDKQSFSDCE